MIVSLLLVIFVVTITNVERKWLSNGSSTSKNRNLLSLPDSLSRPVDSSSPVTPKNTLSRKQEKQEQEQRNRFCDGPSICIFDIGHNTGQDTHNYLSESATTRVVAVDANPVLMQRSARVFSEHIASGRLKLVTTGLIDTTTTTTTTTRTSTAMNKREKNPIAVGLTFWVNTVNHKFSSFKERTGCRSPYGAFLGTGNHSYCRSITVRTRSCANLVHEFGTPDYMKVDIEGLDNVCVTSLAELKDTRKRPKYVSIENVNRVKVRLLESLGYTKFKAVVQNEFDNGRRNDVRSGHSGPWGEAACDYVQCEKWVSGQEMIDRIPLPGATVVAGGKGKRWYDLHATRNDNDRL